jgi:hypothetical protein
MASVAEGGEIDEDVENQRGDSVILNHQDGLILQESFLSLPR